MKFHQNVKQHVTVFAAGHANHDFVAAFNHAKFCDSFSGQAHDAFFILFFGDRFFGLFFFIDRCIQVIFNDNGAVFDDGDNFFISHVES